MYIILELAYKNAVKAFSIPIKSSIKILLTVVILLPSHNITLVTNQGLLKSRFKVRSSDQGMPMCIKSGKRSGFILRQVTVSLRILQKNVYISDPEIE